MKHFSLDGSGWHAAKLDGVRGMPDVGAAETIDRHKYIPVTVPGEIHHDLWKAGLIPDPYLASNILSCRWVEECLWCYRKEFTLTAATLKGNRTYLSFAGLDHAAEIFLNGEKIGQHNNSFIPYRVNVTGRLRAGKNILVVRLDSGLFSVSEKSMEGLNLQGIDNLLHKRSWLRKPAFQFGWDWSGRLINLGITGSVAIELIPLNQPVIHSSSAYTITSENLDQGSVHVSVEMENPSNKPLKVEIHACMKNATARTSLKKSIPPGVSRHELTFKVDHPALWWPVGHGPQNLHTLLIEVKSAQKIILSKSLEIGFRHVRINQEPCPVEPDPEGLQSMYGKRDQENYQPSKGRLFVVEINGRKIFCKGANFVPADMILTRIDKKSYRTLVDRALEANFNLLRVWGGGLYESDEFYAECNRRGILVWQEFIFACAKYPATDPAFLENVKAEARYHIRRLAPHPSLIIWCGNNEMEWLAQWGQFNQQVKSPHCDHALFHHVLPRLLNQEDPSRYYQPSSPYSPEGLHACLDECGDQHTWAVGFANVDFRDFRKMESRFPNEGGFLGPTSLPAMNACLGKGREYIGSFDWQTHDNAVDAWNVVSFPDQITQFWLGKQMLSLSVPEYTYWGGLLQGEALSEYILNFRRRKFDSAAAIFWMFNDCWPATRSWTIVDYFLNRTPSFHPVRRACAPVQVVISVVKNEVVIFGINEGHHPLETQLQFGAFDFDGRYQINMTTPARLEPNQATRIAAFPLSKWKRQNSSAAFAMLYDAKGSLLSRHRFILPVWKEMNWPKPRIKISLRAGQAFFKSEQFALGVCLDLNGDKKLGDNFFDLYPGITYSIPWRSKMPPKILYVGNLI